jgi:hypothetical protein
MKNVRPLTRLVRSSRFAIGGMRASGLPAIFVSIGALVLATGVARTIVESAHLLPESLREARALLEATRAQRGRPPLGS